MAYKSSLKDSDIVCGEKMCEGSLGSVYTCWHKIWGPVSLRKKHMAFHVPLTNHPSILKEVENLKTLHHRNILQLMGTTISTNNTSDNSSIASLVFEPVTYGSLQHFLRINQNQQLPSHVKMSFMYDISLGMSYLHSLNPTIIHGSLDWKSVHITDFFIAKISDFEMKEWKKYITGHDISSACSLSNGSSSAQSFMEDSSVRSDNRTEEPSVHSDVLSYALLCWTIACQKECVVDEARTDRPSLYEMPQDLPNHLSVWIQAWWDPNPSSRPPFSEIKQLLETYVSENARHIEDAKIQLLINNKTYNSSGLDSEFAANHFSQLDTGMMHESNVQDISGSFGNQNSNNGHSHFGPVTGGFNITVPVKQGVNNLNKGQKNNVNAASNHSNSHGAGEFNHQDTNAEYRISGVQHIQIGHDNVLNIEVPSVRASGGITKPKHQNIHWNKPQAQKKQQKVKKIEITNSQKQLDVKNIEMLANEIGLDWKQLARKLRFTDGEIDQIDHDNIQLYEKIYQCLRQWVEKMDCEATLCAVADALIAINKLDVAAKIQDM